MKVSTTQDLKLTITDSEEVSECRVCHQSCQLEQLIESCLCSGSFRYTHLNCLSEWMQTNGQDWCPICFSKFKVEYQKVEHNFWKYLKEQNWNQFLKRVVLNSWLVFATLILLEIGISFWKLKIFVFFWFIILSLLAIDLSFFILLYNSWIEFYSGFKHWQQNNYQIICVTPLRTHL